MRARSAVLATLASGAILLIGWQTGNQLQPVHRGTAAGAAPRSGGTGAASPGSGTKLGPSGPAPAGGAKDGTFTGAAIPTQYGTIQVNAVISGGKIKDIVPLQMTDVGSRSGEIDQEAVPILRSEVLSSQSANVDMVSGATYTSQGYLDSLQAALDVAGFKG